MTNPDQTVGTNAGFNGRTTPNAMNDILGAFSRGRISGWACSPKSGMTVQLGGDGTTRDVAIAEDNAGNRLTIDNRSATPVEITLAGAPATGNRIDSIVAYIANPPQGAGATSVDFPDAVGIIAVQGTASGTPSAPNEATIRAGITADGASGASAYYVILANITVGQGVTTIGSGAITAGAYAQLSTSIVDPTPADGSITTAKLADGAVTPAKIDYSSMGPVWSSFYFSGTSLSDQTVNVTTKKGRALALRISAGGTAIRIISGSQNINAIRQFWSAKLDGVAAEYGVSGLKSASPVYTRFFGSMGATAIGDGEVPSTASSGTDGMCEANLGTVSNAARTSTTAEFLLLRESTDAEGWTIYGKIGSGGMLADASFGAKTQSAAGYAPTVYQRSATSSNASYVFNCIEVLEA